MKSSRSRGRILLAIDRLAAEMPLHAGIIAQWRLVEDTVIGTMAIGYHRGRLALSYNPEFVESITLDETVAVLCHEAGHIIFGHCTHEPAEGENPRVMTVAEEVTTNEWVAGPLPGKPILLADYPSLPENEDTQTRYERLLTILPPEQQTLDDHSRWEQIRASGAMGSAVIATAISRVWNRLTPEQKAKIDLPEAARKAVEDAVKSAGASGIGTGTASVPWQKVLRCYVGRSLRRRPVFGRVPRRFPELVGVIPATGRQASKPKVMAVIDTSGSMTPAILADISTELSVMNRTHEVLVVECDDLIRAVYPYRAITEVGGRGGTDFRPVFDSAFLRTHRPDLVVYFTDGHGPAPVAPPPMPVIWCLTAHGKHPCSWGRFLRMA